jgi:hypothetical protein
MLAWIAWSLSDRVELHEVSTRVEVGERANRRTVVEAHGSTHSVRAVRQRQLTAEFPAGAAERLQPGQTAVVRVGGEMRTTRAGERTPRSTAELPATVTDVDVDGASARAVLWVQLREHEPDPFEHAGTVEVDVTVASASQLGVLAFGPNGPATVVANGSRSQE